MPGAQQSGECRRWHVAGSRPQAGSDVLRDALHPLLSLCSWVLTSPGAFSSLGPGPGRASGAMFLPLGCRRGFPRKVGGFAILVLLRSRGCRCGWERRNFAGQGWGAALPSLGVPKSQESTAAVWGRTGNRLGPRLGEEGGQASGSPSLLSIPCALSTARSVAGWTTAAPRSWPGRAALGAALRERQAQMVAGKGAGAGASSHAASGDGAVGVHLQIQGGQSWGLPREQEKELRATAGKGNHSKTETPQ